MELLTRKYGPLPGWAWAALALAGGLAFFYLRQRGSSTGSTSSSGSLVNNPAASTVPYVPSVTVTGIPQGATTPSVPAPTGSSPGAVWQFGPVPAGTQTVWSATPTGKSHFQQTTGGAWPGGVRPGTPDPSTDQSLGNFGWQWAIVPSGTDPGSYAQQLNQSGSGGQGGWGYAGGAAPAGALGGWTVGWFPTAAPGPGYATGGAGGAGGPAAGNRKAPRGRLTSRFLGQGGGRSRSRGSERPLRRRSLSGR